MDRLDNKILVDQFLHAELFGAKKILWLFTRFLQISEIEFFGGTGVLCKSAQ